MTASIDWIEPARGGSHARSTMKAFSVLSVLVVFVLHSISAGADFEPTIAVTNAKVLSGSGGVWEHGTIVMEKGRITAAGENTAPPAGAMILDAAGLYVYPGFIDANSHLGMSRQEPE